MRDVERKERYLAQVNIQRLKMLNAYGKALSYVSKLEHEPLSNLMTDDELRELEQTKSKMIRLIDKMHRFTHKNW